MNMPRSPDVDLLRNDLLKLMVVYQSEKEECTVRRRHFTKNVRNLPSCSFAGRNSIAERLDLMMNKVSSFISYNPDKRETYKHVRAHPPDADTNSSSHSKRRFQSLTQKQNEHQSSNLKIVLKLDSTHEPEEVLLRN